MGDIDGSFSHQIILGDILVEHLDVHDCQVMGDHEKERVAPSGVLSGFVSDLGGVLLCSPGDDTVGVHLGYDFGVSGEFR